MAPGKLMETPLVSVLMTAYNREKFISEAIESVLHSTYSNFELIIVDDCSSDQTLAIAKSYKEKDIRIRVYKNEKNLGDYPNRNKAASYAAGKYLKYLDSDDTLLDFGLEYCVNQMEKYQEAAMGMLVLYDMQAGESICWSSEKIIREHFFTRPYLWIGPTGSIYRRDMFFKMGGFDTRFGVASDTFFNIALGALYPVVLMQRPFMFYREHDGQEKNNKKAYLKFSYLYFNELMQSGNLPLKQEEIRYLYLKMKKRHSLNLIKYLFKTGDMKSVQQIMKETGYNFSKLISGFFN